MDNNKENKNYFGVRHYNVKVVKEKIKPFKFISSVISYAIFIWLLLIGLTLLVYIADIKIRAAKGDNTPPKYNAYVVLTGSMIPEIMPKDVVITKKRDAKELEVNDIITFVSSDPRLSNIIVTHRIKNKYYDSTTGKYTFQTKLLGKHNVYNILAAIALGRELGVSMDELISAVKLVRPVEHRLELKKLGNFYQIDDAYNSNPVGAKNACQVLKMMNGIRIVVTPGMVELGKKEEEYNKEFGREIAEVADYAVLIGEKKTKPIYEGLLTKGFDKDKIIVFNDVREAYAFINGIYNGKDDIYALFENDLPDTYNE